MANATLDRLLTTLAVRIHAFAMCEIKTGWRLVFGPMDAVTIHYVLAGTGSLRTTGGVDTPYAPFSIIVIPSKVAQIIGEAGEGGTEVSAVDNCGLVADRLVRFTAGDGSRDTFIVCATISATYGGALGLFDNLRCPVAENVSENDSMRGLFAAMLEETTQPAVGTQALIEAMMKQCLILLLRRHLTQFDVTSPFFALLGDGRLADAVASVVERPSALHTVDSLAATAGMSRSTFAARFSEMFQQTPIDFVQHVRLRLGADLLQTTTLPINLIASIVGYGSRSYFTRTFRVAYATDPKSFRARAAEREQASQLVVPTTLAKRVISAVESVLDDRE